MSLKDLDKTVVLLRKNDSVGVLRCPVKPGDELVNGPLRFQISQPIGAGHKIALHEVADGAPVRKYGQVIGFARGLIRPGEHVHTHNLATKDFDRDYEFCTEAHPVQYHPSAQMRYFQ